MVTIVRKVLGDTDEKLIAKFRRKVQLEGILLELRERERYRKPSEIRKEKLKALKKGRRRRYVSR